MPVTKLATVPANTCNSNNSHDTIFSQLLTACTSTVHVEELPVRMRSSLQPLNYLLALVASIICVARRAGAEGFLWL